MAAAYPGSEMVGSTNPNAPVRPLLRRLAAGLARYPSSPAMRLIRVAVSGPTPARSLSAFETVLGDTPAAAATSRIVARGVELEPFPAILSHPTKTFSC